MATDMSTVQYCALCGWQLKMMNPSSDARSYSLFGVTPESAPLNQGRMSNPLLRITPD